ncbi:arylsulfatase [Limibacter armeniacum]|uniref:arylsulfatase n=1 Tax=Limibacter armeniacum TaxID=466084 RepID=UPI002FE5F61F
MMSLSNSIQKILTAVLLFSVLLNAGCQKTDKKSELPKQPNVVYILVDDLGYGDLTAYGQQTIKTPHLSRMADEGMLFTDHYAGSTVCAPSRAALLTGKHTGNSSVRGNHPAQVQILADEDVTVAEVFKQAGYKTANIGKWGVGHPIPNNDPGRNGFDYFFGYLNMWHAHNYYPEFLYRNEEKVSLANKLKTDENGNNPWADKPEGNGWSAERTEYTPDLFEQESLKFIEQNKDNPFFLMVTLTIPHANNENLENGMEVPDYGSYVDKDWPEAEKGFAAMLERMDNTVGNIRAKLKELGLEENTLVMFASDNGPHTEGGHDPDFFTSSGECRGTKRDMYDGGIKIPFMAAWPGKIKAGTTTEHLSAFWDLLPTACDLTGQAAPEDINGISFLPTLLGTGEQREHDYLYWEFYEQGGKQAIRKDKWKAIKLNVRSSKQPVTFELYDLTADVGEVNNVADQYPEVVEEMEKLFAEAHRPFSVTDLFSDKENLEVAF